MQFKIDITDEMTEIEMSGYKRNIYKELTRTIISHPHIKEILEEAITAANKAEREQPDMCEKIRKMSKERTDIHMDEVINMNPKKK